MYIQAKNITKRYGKKLAVDEVSLEVRKGQILGLLGPNGAGKTTMINILSGTSKPTSGEIIIDGQSYSKVPTELRGQIGVMPQEVLLWDELTVKENLVFTAKLQEMPANLIDKRVEELVEGLNLRKELNTYAKNLSGGYRRRLNLAISIVHEPSLIFLDEPTPGIDPQNRRFLWEYIDKLRKSGEYSIVLTDHYLDEAERMSDYVVIMDNSKVVASGTADELKKEYGDGELLLIEFSKGKKLTKQVISEIKDAFSSKFQQIEISDNTISIVTKDGIKSIKVALKILSDYDIETTNISLKEPSLEDIFLLLTGKKIRD